MIGFFTRLPVPKTAKDGFTDERYRKAVKLMPLVGLVIGAILTAVKLILSFVEMPAFVDGAIILCVYIFITGGLHFDGLSDTCDGVFSGRSREQSLEIMKDSRIGVFGTLGIFMAGLFYFVMFSNVPAACLIAVPVVGRACCLISASFAPYARKEAGMGSATSREGGAASVISAVISMVGVSFLIVPVYLILLFLDARIPLNEIGVYFLFSSSEFFSGYKHCSLIICSLIAAGVAVLITLWMTERFRKKLGGVTGDTFGAVIEVSSLVYMLFFFILYSQIGQHSGWL